MRADYKIQDNTNFTYVGTGNTTACRALLELLVPKANPMNCHQKPCAIGPAYQPTIASTKQFYAIGSFIHAAKAIKAISPNDTFIPDVVFEKATEYCSRVSMRPKVSFMTYYRPVRGQVDRSYLTAVCVWC